MPKPKKPKPKRTKARNGEGMIRQRADGRWEIRFAGKAAYARSEAEAIEKRAMMLLEAGKGSGIKSKLTFGQLLLSHKEARAKSGARPATLSAYETYIYHYAELASLPLPQITEELIENHFLQLTTKRATVLAAGHKRKPSGRPLAKSILDHIWWFGKAAMRRAVRFGYIPRNPFEFAERPKLKERKRAQILSAEQEVALLEAARLEGPVIHGILYIALSLGLRRGEVLGLTWESIDFEARTINVHQAVTTNKGKIEITGTKTESSTRLLPMTKGVRLVLEGLHQAQGKPKSGWVFPSESFAGTPLNPHNVLRKLRLLLEKAKLPKVRFHDLRHTFISRAVKTIGVKATSTFVGHAKVQQTLDVYTHITDQDLREAAGMLDGLED
jgi:integrase